MNDPKMYRKTNLLQKRDAEMVMIEFMEHFVKSSNKKTLLDVGCGSGDVLGDIIFPKLPDNFIEVVGVDISDEMIKYANQNYETKQLKFIKLDIERDIFSSVNETAQMDHLRPESFDFVTSFYCFHWIQNQRQAISNIHQLLKPNGKCLLTFIASNPIFDVYLKLSQNEKFSVYMTDVMNFISPLHFSSNPLEVFSGMLSDVGFEILHIQIKDQVFIFNNIETLKNSIKAINPFTKRMPDSLKDDFYDEYIAIVDKLGFIRDREDSIDKNVHAPNKLMVAMAKKI